MDLREAKHLVANAEHNRKVMKKALRNAKKKKESESYIANAEARLAEADEQLKTAKAIMDDARLENPGWIVRLKNHPTTKKVAYCGACAGLIGIGWLAKGYMDSTNKKEIPETALTADHI